MRWLLIIAIVGTTVAPWQLFFQQSNIVDKRITPRLHRPTSAATPSWAPVVVVTGAAAIVMTGDWAARSTHTSGRLHRRRRHRPPPRRPQRHPWGRSSRIVLLDSSIIGAAAVTLATSYAFGDVFGLKHSLHRGFGDAKQFYLSYTAMVAAAAAIVLIPGAPAGVDHHRPYKHWPACCCPALACFLLLLCNDREVLGPLGKPALAQRARRA